MAAIGAATPILARQAVLCGVPAIGGDVAVVNRLGSRQTPHPRRRRGVEVGVLIAQAQLLEHRPQARAIHHREVGRAAQLGVGQGALNRGAHPPPALTAERQHRHAARRRAFAHAAGRGDDGGFHRWSATAQHKQQRHWRAHADNQLFGNIHQSDSSMR
ncbi:hypothetical protein MAIT1_03931 [Magnetofaba australis IT-1]|uniref:Uncharacterized protein n=1 Tax=Magnetofaba australis IT-1 TaxID=1434232 RepID=A0A1Y2K8S9_9PROT|nr:hypothetical protein MAIT1_03931 [Magnetofaba australis IT-1]